MNRQPAQARIARVQNDWERWQTIELPAGIRASEKRLNRIFWQRFITQLDDKFRFFHWKDRKGAARLKVVSVSDALKAAGTNITVARGWRQDGKLPSLPVLLRLCKNLEVSADYLLGLSDD